MIENIRILLRGAITWALVMPFILLVVLVAWPVLLALWLFHDADAGLAVFGIAVGSIGAAAWVLFIIPYLQPLFVR